jgi:hypothetical protein
VSVALFWAADYASSPPSTSCATGVLKKSIAIALTPSGVSTCGIKAEDVLKDNFFCLHLFAGDSSSEISSLTPTKSTSALLLHPLLLLPLFQTLDVFCCPTC